jgi:hypothetical protein
MLVCCTLGPAMPLQLLVRTRACDSTLPRPMNGIALFLELDYTVLLFMAFQCIRQRPHSLHVMAACILRLRTGDGGQRGGSITNRRCAQLGKRRYGDGLGRESTGGSARRQMERRNAREHARGRRRRACAGA